ncbi:MAG: TIGR04084 family radical SAM/SPASM domain-containing protein [Candidatus Hadarchaeales archaeon]
MFFHVMLTTRCNLECRYCHGESSEDFSQPSEEIDHNLPEEVSYDIYSLKKFLEKDPEPAVIFYGGEPLLRADLMMKIMDSVVTNAFIVQTNGTLLKNLRPEYISRLHTLAVSIDGDENQTDLNRGNGTFRNVIDNVRWAVENGFRGELIARMTVMEPADIYRQVGWIIDNEEIKFSSVHWQLNAGFWKDYGRRSFKTWVEKTYNPGVRKLVRRWVELMEEDNTVLKIYPLLGIAESLLKGETSGLRCGAGWVNYAIQTDGHIIPCPAMWGMKKYYLGHIGRGDPLKLKKVPVGAPCTSCDIMEICGGRCLYANVMKRWDAEEYKIVCSTVKNLIDAVKDELPRIRSLIHRGAVKQGDFAYTRYNGCEIIP